MCTTEHLETSPCYRRKTSYSPYLLLLYRYNTKGISKDRIFYLSIFLIINNIKFYLSCYFVYNSKASFRLEPWPGKPYSREVRSFGHFHHPRTAEGHETAKENPKSDKTLYARLGGYDAIAAVASDLLPRLQGDPQLGRFWENRAEDGIAREKQLPIDYLSASVGGPMLYTGRDMKLSHGGMGISESD